MNKNYLGHYCLFLMLIFYSKYSLSQQFSPRDLLEKSIEAMDNVKSARYTLKKTERLRGKLIESENKVKLQLSPFRIYLYSQYPNPGAEVLWRKGENSDDVLDSPNKFPYFSISLNPFNSLLREDQHHTILDLGFAYMSNVLKSYIRKYGAKFFSTVKLDGEVIWNTKKLYKLVIENNSFGYLNYTVKKEDKLPELASAFFINDYMILDLNPQIKGYNDIKEGQIIKIPNSYAQKIIFYIDKESNLPLMQAIYDDKGLYEKFEISNLIINPRIPPNEFTPSFKEYSF